MEATTISGPRILVVDDDEAIRDMLTIVLQRRGVDVTKARNGKEALKVYKQHTFDLVVTDLIMPDKEGIEMILEMRAKKLPLRILAISGGGKVHQSMHLNLAKSVGADRVLSKPFLPQDFLRIVDEMLAVPARA